MNTAITLSRCRLCLHLTSSVLSVFCEEGEKLHLKEILTILFPFDITESTASIICTSCYNIVNDFYNFYKMVLINQKSHFHTIENTGSKELLAANEENTTQTYVLSFDTGIENTEKNCQYENEDAIRPIVKIEITPANVYNESEYHSSQSSISNHFTDAEPDNPSHLQPTTDVTNTDLNISMKLKNRKDVDNLLPDHLKRRISKRKGDAQIKEFVKLTCDLCAKDKLKIFQSFKKLIEHYDIVHHIRGYASCCDKKFFRKDRLMNHITNHINPDAFKCPKCGQNSKSKVLLRIHMKQHLPTEERQFQCEKCPQKFVLRSQLKNHQACHLTDEEKKYICDDCGKAFGLKFVMMKHRLIHSNEKNFVCDVCAKPFATKCNLQSHMQYHHIEQGPKVQCEHCLRWYKNIDTLRTHKRRHTDARVHICSTCKKECSSQSTLAAHIRYVHLKISNFECNVCQKKFRRKLELTEHMARHTGEILYKCPFCPKTFACSSNYFAHRKNHHAKYKK